MFGNVWGVIWRNQKTVIKSAQGVMEGQAALPAGRRRRPRSAAIASRTNVVLSLPLLFFMAFTSHLAAHVGDPEPESSKRLMWWAPMLVVIVLIELNGLGVIGGIGQGPTKKYLEKHTTAIATGAGLAVAFYVWFEVCFG